MKGNAQFTQPKFDQYKKDLSPFGQKIFNVLITNWNTDKQRCTKSTYHSGFDRGNGQKRKLLTFEDAHTPQSPVFGQNEPLQDYFKDGTRNTYFSDNHNTIMINDHDVGDFFTSDEQLLQTNSKDRPSDVDAGRCQHDSVLSKPVGDKPNATSAGLLQLQLNSLQNNAKQDAPNVTSADLLLPSNATDDACISDVLYQNNAVQINAVQDQSNVNCADLLQFNGKQNNVKDNRVNVVPARLKQFDSVPNNVQEGKSTITAAEFLHINSATNIVYGKSPNATSAILLNEDRASISLLHFDSVQNMVTNGRPDASIGFPKNAAENNTSVCRIDLLQPLDKFCSESSSKSLDIFELSTPIDISYLNEESNVPWSNMFDTELVPSDIIVPAVKEKMITKQNVDSNKMGDKKKTEKKAKCMKRKKEQPEEKSPKKIKEINTKSRVRKEKYTKTVKKWLDGVNPNNPVETENNQESENIQDSNKPIEPGSRKEEHKTEKKTLVSKKQKSSAKKVVQARLANKGGIMKFDKPEVEQDSGKNSSCDTAVEVEFDSKVANKVTTKKGKPRFVAPLKSQVPVKEIDFSVISINENNWEEHSAKLQSSNITELYAVLTYSNGFNQLNKQFTEDDCIPEGIMLLIDEEFYYFQKTNDRFSAILSKFLENQTVVCYDGKNILIFLKHFDLDANFVMQDVKIGGSLVEPDSPPDSFGALQRMVSSVPEYRPAAQCRLQKAAWCLTLLRSAARRLQERLRELALWSLFEDIEMKVLPAIADMEFLGIMVDTARLQAMAAALQARLRELQLQCRRAAGRDFQPTAPAQVAAILYDQLQLHTKCNLTVRETLSRGAKSTSEAMLRTLVPSHPLPGLILEYRRLHKAHATFLAGIGQHVKDGVLKPTWEQSAAATGRIASSNPNVQAIPKAPFSLSSDADNPETELNLRSLYVARAGHVLLAADFQQVECRVFARAAGDGALLAALAAHADLFTALASKWLGKPEALVSAADRERTKHIVYARLYGAGVRKLMDILHVSYDRALSISASFDRTFPSLKTFGQSVERQCAEGRAPRTPSGRVRPLPALASADPAERAHALRQAVNFLVQGTAADVCKVAMVRARAQLAARGLRARLLLQLHDELVWEVARGELRPASAVVRAAMESAGRPALGALPVALRAGRSWGQLREIRGADP